MALLQPKEAKNIRFDFKTDDLQFHSSEEDYEEEEEMELEEEEEMLEEEEEEEEYYEEEEEEEEFDSEAEDPEEEALLKARGVIDDYSDDQGLVLNDASDLLPSAPQARPRSLPSSADPWAGDPSAGTPSRDSGASRDPLKEFRRQKEEDQRKQGVEAGKGKADQTPQGKQPAKVQATPPSAPAKQVQNPQPKPATLQTPAPQGPKKPQPAAARPAAATPGQQGAASESKGKPVESQTKPSDPIKKPEAPVPPEDRKLELEGAPKQRKTNPLDRVVAKLSGRTEPKEPPQSTAQASCEGKATPKPSEMTPKNLTVNLNKLMEKEETEEEESQTAASKEEQKVKIDYAEIQRKIQEEASKFRVAEEQKIRKQQEEDLKALRERLNKEFRDMEEKIRKENAATLQKYQEEEKKKTQAAQKQLETQLQADHRKKTEEIKARLIKEAEEERERTASALRKENEKEAEKIKLEYVQEMQKKKEEMQLEHEEEMQELEDELKALYQEQKEVAQAEVGATKAAIAARNSNEAAAVADLERSLTEVLRERQADVKREHHKQLTVLRDELEEELEMAARQAKEKENAEKKAHAARLARLKEEHEAEVRQSEETHEQDIKDLETQHEEDLAKLKADFKAELTLQKTELENKLTEFRIEYEQRMSSMENGEENVCEEEIEREDFVNEDSLQSQSNVRERKAGNVTSVKAGRLKDEEKKYDQILKELRDRRMSLEEDLEELKAQESKVKELKKQKQVVDPSSCCEAGPCLHESKYKKMKARYSSLVSRIKSEKAKKSRKMAAAQELSSLDMHSLSGDRNSTESQVNVSDGGQQSDMTSSLLSSPKPSPHHIKSTSEASEDEELQLAMQVMGKYSRISDYSLAPSSHLSTVNGSLKHTMTKPMVSTPKKAWLEDDLLAHGRKVLSKTEKFLRANQLRDHTGNRDIKAEDIQREILRQNADFETLPSRKIPSRRLSLAHGGGGGGGGRGRGGGGRGRGGGGGSLTSDTESDEPTQEVPSGSSDFGLDQILAKISSETKQSPVHQRRRPYGTQESPRPLRATASLERGLNNICYPLNPSGYNTVTPTGPVPVRLNHLNAGSVPDLGPDTVDRIAGVNQYLQQKWTNYFGELSVPLGGKAGWPSQVIGQSTFFLNKNSTSKFFHKGDVSSSATGKNHSPFVATAGMTTVTHQEDINITQKIDDLRAWLDSAQATSAVLSNANK
ncbi:trichohyalin-like isoform X2 [Penaeus indicus]